jgi:hypothetical protein
MKSGWALVGRHYQFKTCNIWIEPALPYQIRERGSARYRVVRMFTDQPAVQGARVEFEYLRDAMDYVESGCKTGVWAK